VPGIARVGADACLTKLVALLAGVALFTVALARLILVEVFCSIAENAGGFAGLSHRRLGLASRARNAGVFAGLFNAHRLVLAGAARNALCRTALGVSSFPAGLARVNGVV
jgi:hypothetical protein